LLGRVCVIDLRELTNDGARPRRAGVPNAEPGGGREPAVPRSGAALT